MDAKIDLFQRPPTCWICGVWDFNHVCHAPYPEVTPDALIDKAIENRAKTQKSGRRAAKPPFRPATSPNRPKAPSPTDLATLIINAIPTNCSTQDAINALDNAKNIILAQTNMPIIKSHPIYGTYPHINPQHLSQFALMFDSQITPRKINK